MEPYKVELEKARVLIDLNREEEASRILEKLKLTEPTDFNIYNYLSYCYLALSNKEKLEETTRKLISLSPEYAFGYYYRARCFLLFEKNKEAEEMNLLALKLDSTNAIFHSLLAHLYIKKKEWQKALNFAEAGLSCDPEYLFCILQKIDCLGKLNQKNGRWEMIQNALILYPNNSLLLEKAGWCKLELGNFEEAKSFFSESLLQDPLNNHAKEGFIQAIKATNFFYGKYLSFAFLDSKYNIIRTTSTGLVSGLTPLFISGISISKLVAKFPICYLLLPFFFVLICAILLIKPISTLFLLQDKFGKNMVSKDQKIACYIASISVFSGVLLSIFAYILKSNTIFCVSMFFGSIAVLLAVYFLIEEIQRTLFLKALFFVVIGIGAALLCSNVLNPLLGYAYYFYYLLFLLFFSLLIFYLNEKEFLQKFISK